MADSLRARVLTAAAGFAAQVPAGAVAELLASPAVVSVTPDRTVKVPGASTTSAAASAAKPAPADRPAAPAGGGLSWGLPTGLSPGPPEP
jgi:hypothetical protein